MGDAQPCPVCGTQVTLPTHETVTADDGAMLVSAVVVTDPGTATTHLRDEHPDVFERHCQQQRAVNSNPFIDAMPRKVDGTFLLAGEDVGDVR